MAGDLGPSGKPLAPKVAKTATSGNPGGASAPGGSTFRGTRPSPTPGKSKNPK